MFIDHPAAKNKIQVIRITKALWHAWHIQHARTRHDLLLCCNLLFSFCLDAKKMCWRRRERRTQVEEGGEGLGVSIVPSSSFCKIQVPGTQVQVVVECTSSSTRYSTQSVKYKKGMVPLPCNVVQLWIIPCYVAWWWSPDWWLQICSFTTYRTLVC